MIPLWRSRVPAAVTAAAAISIGVFAEVESGGGSRKGSNGDGLGAFNTCITHTRFLVLVRHGYGNSVVVTIEHRMRGAVVGEVTAGATHGILGGAAAGNGRYVMSTATPLGRDATAIERCWDRFFPIAPDA